MAAEENDRDGVTAPKASQQGRSAGGQGTVPSSDPDPPVKKGHSPRPGPARQPDPLPDQARRAPLLRANPYSEVTDPICRLPLPTLVYRLEALYLGDLLRIWVRPGARFTPSPPDFQGPARAHRTPPEPRRFPGRGPLSRGEPIPGRPALHKEKRTLPGAPAGFSGFVCVTALGA